MNASLTYGPQLQSCCRHVTVYFSSITQKVHKTLNTISRARMLALMWSYVVEETGQPGENHRHLTCDH